MREQVAALRLICTLLEHQPQAAERMRRAGLHRATCIALRNHLFESGELVWQRVGSMNPYHLAPALLAVFQ
jgi:hypothetical protein